MDALLAALRFVGATAAVLGMAVLIVAPFVVLLPSRRRRSITSAPGDSRASR